MNANLLAGKVLAESLKQTLIEKIKMLRQQGFPQPGLAVILANDTAASQSYVNTKRRLCKAVGIQSFDYDLPVNTSEEKLLSLIQALNQKKEVHGILVQLPLPKAMDTQKIIEAIDPRKDVDGFHPYNLGRLAQRKPLLRPCTPYGIIQLLGAHPIPLVGKHAVIVGASNIVGRPMALEFLMAGATVTVCHRKTPSLEPYIRMADIIVVATGVKNVIPPDWFMKHQVVVDVGIHRLDNGQWCGDLDFEAVKHQVAWITPVPGGVGPMTVITLLQNTVAALELQMQ